MNQTCEITAMKKIEIKVECEELKYDELSEEDRKLVDTAKEMTRSSYVPYSRFHVGAALYMANGRIVRGSNQENAAFSPTMCAERNAMFQAGAIYPGVRPEKIAIAAWTLGDRPEDTPYELCFQGQPISPCGVCRQALLEYETLYGPIQVILYGRERILRFSSVASLLPYCFTEF